MPAALMGVRTSPPQDLQPNSITSAVILGMDDALGLDAGWGLDAALGLDAAFDLLAAVCWLLVGI